jgi:hypothetical protein
MAPQMQAPKGSGIGFVVVQAVLLGFLFFGPAHLNPEANHLEKMSEETTAEIKSKMEE